MFGYKRHEAVPFVDPWQRLHRYKTRMRPRQQKTRDTASHLSNILVRLLPYLFYVDILQMWSGYRFGNDHGCRAEELVLG